jgi:predicted aminopeptidase
MPSFLVALLDRFRHLTVPLLLVLLLSGCASVDYYAQLGVGQWQLLRAREPVAEVLADPTRDAGLRQRLALTQQARDFASAHLHLPDNRSYRLYADIHRPFVVWNVFATPELSLAPRTWCFPIAGCVAYRGFYQPGRARGAAALLRQQGLDVYVGGVEAYSTLGWFADPLLSSMLRRDDEQLAAVIFHELAHQQLYVAGDTEFNESWASFVEQEGLRQWRASRDLPPENGAAERQREQFTALVLDTRARLDALYASGQPEATLRQGKAAEFQRLRERYYRLRDGQWHGERRYDAWIAGPLNNAKLLPFGLYDQYVPAFAALFAQVGGDWPIFQQRVAALGALPAEQRHARLRALANLPSAAPVKTARPTE